MSLALPSGGVTWHRDGSAACKIYGENAEVGACFRAGLTLAFYDGLA